MRTLERRWILPVCVGFLTLHKQASHAGWGFERVFVHLQSTYEHAVLKQTRIITSPYHMLQTEQQLLPSGRRSRVPHCQFNNPWVKKKQTKNLRSKGLLRVAEKKRTSNKQPSASAKPLSLTQAFRNVTKYANNSKRWKEIATAFVFMAPVVTVEHSGWYFLLKLEKGSSGPLQKYFSQT